MRLIEAKRKISPKQKLKTRIWRKKNKAKIRKYRQNYLKKPGVRLKMKRMRSSPAYKLKQKLYRRKNAPALRIKNRIRGRARRIQKKHFGPSKRK